jgi:thioredoxin reductase (NADPH)
MEHFDLVVVGAGTAGLVAAATAAQRGASVMVLDAQGVGGQVATVEQVAGMPGLPVMPGWELGPMLQEQAEAAGAAFMMASAESLRCEGAARIVVTSEGPLSARAVIIASGSHRRTLGVPGEERLQGFGVSHCASCDGPLYRGLRVCVVGGGNAAASEALALSAHVGHVTLLHRGALPKALPALLARLHQSPSIRLVPNCEVEEVLGDRHVTGLLLRDIAAGSSQRVETEGVFVYIGLAPNTRFLDGQLNLDAAGRVLTDLCLQSSVPGVFAAGDVRSGSAALLVASAGDGATAGESAVRYLAATRP